MCTGITPTDIKNSNRGLVLRLIASNSNYSRASIAAKINLSKMTITNIVNELIDEHYVTETILEENNNIGRNPIHLDIAPDAPKVLGLYLSRKRIHSILTDLSGTILYQESYELSLETNRTLTQKMFALVQNTLVQTASPILGIGVSSIGPIDSENGILLTPVNFHSISNYSIKTLLEDRFSLPVFINNDMNASALAEKMFGTNNHSKNFIYIGISDDISCGIVSNGKLYQDRSGYAGNVGHVGICYDGPPCTCGRNGCLETYFNMPLLLSKLRYACNDDSLLYSDFERICEQKECKEIFQDMMNKLAFAIITTANILDPQVILIGHEGAFIPDAFIDYLQKEANDKILAASHKYISIKKSSFGINTPLIGSACCLLNEIFTGNFFPLHSKQQL